MGEKLKEKFDAATEVETKKVRGRFKLRPNRVKFRQLSSSDLVFVAASPKYCDYDPSGGSLGTRGRECLEVGTKFKIGSM